MRRMMRREVLRRTEPRSPRTWAGRWTWLAVPLLCAACSSPSFKDRAADAAQIFDVAATFGPGIEMSGRLTSLAQAGAGSFDGRALGLREGRLVDVREQRSELGLSLLHTYEFRRDGGERLLDVHHPRWGDPGHTEFPLSFESLTDRHPVDVGLTFHLLYLGVDAAFHPLELYDFVAGCFGADPSGDDAFSSSPEERAANARSLDARRRARAFDARLRRGEDVFGYAIYTAADVRSPVQRRALEALARAEGRVGEPAEDVPEPSAEFAPEEPSRDDEGPRGAEIH